ncbi:hypothetical protein [Streptomyces sp. NRRL F-2890]|uniref:hypothetical protein n=1 Tax=Streptomyces sp. NRRL F-2890 TaxID=1463845 RepID=UPI00131A5FA4|nr:hypothetical protein [Streptomyces sp. NRRL F-2890]
MKDASEKNDAARLRAAMEHAVADLHTDAHVLPNALVLGPRRRARARALRTGGVLCAAAAVAAAVFGPLNPLTWGAETKPAVPPAAEPSPDGSPDAEHRGGQTYDVVPPDDGTSPDYPGLSADELARVTDYRQRVAAVLDGLLPEQITTVQIVQGEGNVYRALTEDGLSFDILFNVRPLAGAGNIDLSHVGGCLAEEDARTCRVAQLATGETVSLRGLTPDMRRVGGASAQFYLGGSYVGLSVGPDGPTHTPPPVTADDLLAWAGEPDVVELLHEADEDPLYPDA